MKALLRLRALGAAAGGLLTPADTVRAQLLITGNDDKVSFDETGKTVTLPPGKDMVSIIDIHDPTKPRIVANHAGNFVDGDVDIIRVDGDTLTKVASFALSGHPASMRGSTP
jgi:hypothetical protein